MNVGVFLDGAVQPRDGTPFTEVSGNTQAITLFGPNDEGRLWWVAAENKYFAFITAPVEPDGEEGPGYVYEVSAADLDGEIETTGDVAPQTVLVLSLPPEESTSLRMEHYIGPKDKRVFKKNAGPDWPWCEATMSPTVHPARSSVPACRAMSASIGLPAPDTGTCNSVVRWSRAPCCRCGSRFAQSRGPRAVKGIGAK